MKIEIDSVEKVTDSAVKRLEKILVGAMLSAVLTILMLDFANSFREGINVLFAGGTIAPVLDAKMAGGTDMGKIFLILPMLLPIAFSALFLTSVLRVRRTRFSLSFVIPVTVLSVFCFVMATVNLFLGQDLQTYVFLVLELFSVSTLMVYNLIDNRQRLNVGSSVRRAGLVGLCVCLLALPLASGSKGNGDQSDDRVQNEITITEK